MDQNRINYLLKQFAEGNITSDEKVELEILLSSPNREELVEYITSLMQQERASGFVSTSNSNTGTFGKIISSDKTNITTIGPASRIRPRFWIGAAAAVILLLSIGAWFYLSRNKKDEPARIAATRKAIPEKDPGRNTAILTLGDNSFVELDSAGNGVISTQGGSVVQLANGELAYQAQANAGTVTYNKISTPKGGEFTVTLSDGTKVWLNAASSIRFPTVFSGSKREVELTGEAYMEVTEDSKHPFEVKIRGVNVTVLGTQFNVNGYEDEDELVTTLVSGRVRVSATGSNDQLLQPGQHAVFNNGNGHLFVEKADVAEETAWKNGKTWFNGANIRQIMRQISRWYNVDVEYRGNVVNMDFTCTVSRKDKLSKLLSLLELTGAVEFTMEGNTIIVH
ncbi:FecR family protein [Pseudoflavitalea rhizosphaerae]|uniref:FecR family protein n=1 Tax=Pseudoflavitalea rhizosphaerae TaxID=1884793 RepID=UPI000F8F4B39|nr:FecR family protein [Pseudoflavitalea rhizosphaerae]